MRELTATPRGSPDRQVALLWGGVALLTVLASPFVPALAPLLPPCPWKVWTGWPCLGCGSTRALMALARLDLAPALRANPLAALGAMAFVAGGLGAGVLALAGREVALPSRLPLGLRLGAVGAMVGTWVFLVLDGR